MKIKTYKLIVAGLAILLSVTLITSIVLIYSNQLKAAEETKNLVVENERLRSFNVRRERRLKWINHPKQIDMESVSLASHLLGIKPSVVAALIHCENGPEFLETGAIDKTDYFAQHFPIERWSALDGSRTLNRMLWEHTLADKKRTREFLLYAAKPYTNLSKVEQKAWADNMAKAELRFREDISGKKESATVMSIRTPTPKDKK